MMTLIIGGSGSGKSAYEENYITRPSKETTKYYIATMQVFDSEGQKKVQRHRMLRSGKGFVTIEQSADIFHALKKMKTGKKMALLECISNLTANEMFSEAIIRNEEIVVNKIITELAQLNQQLTHFVIVSNNVFEDGNVYDETTMEYIRAMGQINNQLAKMADEVIEVVVGIPVIVKKNRKG